jgi:hypothetical protein
VGLSSTLASCLEVKRGKFVTAFNLQRPPQQAARELEGIFAARKRNPVPDEVRAEKAIENVMLGNDASSLHL